MNVKKAVHGLDEYEFPAQTQSITDADLTASGVCG